MSQFLYTVEQIDQMLRSQIERLARELAPDGMRRGHEWVAKNPARADTRAGSFSVNLTTGVWADFAAGEGGRTLAGLSLVAYLATEGDFKRAVLWAKRWLGIDGKAPDPALVKRAEETARKSKADQAAARDTRRRIAFALFLNAVPLTGACPASLYLKGRGLDPALMEGGRFPRALRFHPRLTHPAFDGHFPGLVACLSLEGAPGGFGGVHRIYLAQTNGVWGKAFGKKQSKVVLGYVPGATVRLARGRSGKALADAPAGEWLLATEGIEDGLALSLLMPGERVVAAYSLGALGQMVFPPTIGGVTVVGDNDTGNVEAERSLELRMLDLAERYEVKLARLPDRFKDVNDVLQGKVRAQKGLAS